MPKISILQLKQHSKNSSKENLTGEITELFKKFPAVQEYYQAKLVKGGNRELQEKYKDIIKIIFKSMEQKTIKQTMEEYCGYDEDDRW